MQRHLRPFSMLEFTFELCILIPSLLPGSSDSVNDIASKNA